MANIIQQKTGEMKAAPEKKTMQQYIKSMESEIAKALPSVLTPERFTRMVLTALSTTPKLAQCTPSSFLGAMMTAAQLGMEVNTPLGQAYILPYWNSKKKCFDATFQLGYKGMVDLAYRSGDVKIIQSHVVYENDEFEFEYGIDPKLRHIPADHDRGEPVRVYAMFITKEGGYGFGVMSMDDVRQHAEKYSKSYGDGYTPWKSSFNEMAKKTCLKKVLKLAPMKSDFVLATAHDGVIRQELSKDMIETPAEVIDADFTVEPETGEIVDG